MIRTIVDLGDRMIARLVPQSRAAARYCGNSGWCGSGNRRCCCNSPPPATCYCSGSSASCS